MVPSLGESALNQTGNTSIVLNQQYLHGRAPPHNDTGKT